MDISTYDCERSSLKSHSQSVVVRMRWRCVSAGCHLLLAGAADTTYSCAQLP